MKIVNIKNTDSELSSNEIWSQSALTEMSHREYHELADLPVVEISESERLTKNLNQLIDLQHQYSFLMREIRYLMKVE